MQIRKVGFYPIDKPKRRPKTQKIKVLSYKIPTMNQTL